MVWFDVIARSDDESSTTTCFKVRLGPCISSKSYYGSRASFIVVADAVDTPVELRLLLEQPDEGTTLGRALIPC